MVCDDWSLSRNQFISVTSHSVGIVICDLLPNIVYNKTFPKAWDYSQYSSLVLGVGTNALMLLSDSPIWFYHDKCNDNINAMKKQDNYSSSSFLCFGV